MKIILKIFLILLLFGCSNTYNSKNKLPNINLIVQQDKYSLILKHNFLKHLDIFNNNLDKITIKTNLSFYTNEALSNNGNNNLNIIKGKVNFKVFDTLNTEVSSGSVSTSINTGSISSLYAVDENTNFAKERISKRLGSKLFKKILLYINSRES